VTTSPNPLEGSLIRQSPDLILAIVAMVVNYVSNNTRFGRYIYAIGGNREAARLSGVNIRNNLFTIFVLMGFLCGVSGVVLASYVAAALLLLEPAWNSM
jgi:D-xylose transport system permease protein